MAARRGSCCVHGLRCSNSGLSRPMCRACESLVTGVEMCDRHRHVTWNVHVWGAAWAARGAKGEGNHRGGAFLPTLRLVFWGLTFQSLSPLSLAWEKTGCAGPLEGTHQPRGQLFGAALGRGLLWPRSRDGTLLRCTGVSLWQVAAKCHFAWVSLSPTDCAQC